MVKKQMIKKGWIIAMLMALFITGCGKKVVCDLCDEKKSCTVKKIAGETVNICDDCMTEISEY